MVLGVPNPSVKASIPRSVGPSLKSNLSSGFRSRRKKNYEQMVFIQNKEKQFRKLMLLKDVGITFSSKSKTVANNPARRNLYRWPMYSIFIYHTDSSPSLPTFYLIAADWPDSKLSYKNRISISYQSPFLNLYSRVDFKWSFPTP